MRSLVGMLVLAPVLGLVDVDAGLSAYASGRFEEARHVFERAVTQAGSDATPELLLDLALSAARDGDLRAADEVLARAAAHPATRGEEADAEVVARLDLLRGGLALRRCRQAAELIGRAEAEPFLLVRALAQAEDALASFARATRAAPDEAGRALAARNAERAARALAVLEALRDQLPEPERQPEDPPPPPPEPDTPGREQDAEAADEPELGPAELERLLVALERERQEQRAVRRARRVVRSADVERDW